MLFLVFIYVLVLIYVAICVFSTDLLFIGKKAKYMFTDDAGVKIFKEIERYPNMISCNPINTCLNDTNYYKIYMESVLNDLNKKTKQN